MIVLVILGIRFLWFWGFVKVCRYIYVVDGEVFIDRGLWVRCGIFLFIYLV